MRGSGVLKTNGLFLPMSRKSKPLPGVAGTGFPRIPFAMWFLFRAAQRGSCGWKESRYYSQEAVVVIPGNEQAFRRLATPILISSATHSSAQLLTSTRALGCDSTGTAVIAIQLSPREGRSQTPLPSFPFRVPGMLMIWAFPQALMCPPCLCFSDRFSGPPIPSFSTTTLQCLPHVYKG